MKATIHLPDTIEPKEGEHPRYIVQKELDRINALSPITITLDET